MPAESGVCCPMLFDKAVQITNNSVCTATGKQLDGTVHRTVSVLPGQVGVIQFIGVLLECCWECSTWLMCTAVQRCCCTASCSLLSGVLLNNPGRVLLVCADFLLALRSVVILSHHLVTSAPHLPSCYKLSTF
jgi:hypothetical protein